MIHIREVLRRLTLGPRYLRYWQSLRNEELKRLGYDVDNQRPNRNRKQARHEHT